jgi:predicted enzyme related to lactoylglutathione lyase
MEGAHGSARSPVIAGRGLAEIARLVQAISGLRVEFEIPDRHTAAMRDDADLTVFLYEGEVAPCPGISFTIQVDDVDAKHRELSAAGIAFVHPPMKVFWGYGAELCDPDGYRLRLWDAKAMAEK